MSHNSRIPPLLAPYTHLSDQHRFLLLTGILGASPNWLVIRFLCDALSKEQKADHENRGEANEEERETKVVLISFMRDWEFWRAEGRKSGALDLARLSHERRFVFVDGLTRLFLPEVKAEEKGAGTQNQMRQAAIGGLSTSSRVPGQMSTTTPLPVRGPPGGAPTPISPSTTTSSAGPTIPIPAPAPISTSTSNPKLPQFHLKSPTLSALEETINSAIDHLTTSSTSTSTSRTPPKILLILDTPDLLLATTSSSHTPSHIPPAPPSSPPLNPQTLTSLLLRLSQQPPIHTILLTLSADTPLLSPSTPPQPLQTDHLSLLTRVAHISDRILSVRLLDTGVARDVSGVLRITGRNVDGGDEGDGGEEEGREFLYFVGGDGGVRVFVRGAGEG